MDCRNWIAEIVECARAGEDPSSALAAHLHACTVCAHRWESERSLSRRITSLRAALANERAPALRRMELLREFDALHPNRRPRRVYWSFAAAAAVLFALALGLSRPQAPITRSTAVAASEPAGDGDFVAVPYAPPLASGEFVKVVRTELYAAALDRMGVRVPVTNGTFPAEVVFGQDGLPRAVRVLETAQF